MPTQPRPLFSRFVNRETPDGPSPDNFRNPAPVAKAAKPPSIKGAVATIHRTVVRGGQ